MANRQFKVQVNPRLLSWARDSLGYHPDYAAQQLNLNKDHLLRLEEGKERPTYKLLLKMSSLYHRPVAAFLLRKRPDEKPLPRDFRTIESEDIGHFSDKTILAVRNARGLLNKALELYEDLNIRLPEFDLNASLSDNLHKLAGEVRNYFKISDLWGLTETTNIQQQAEWAFDAFIERFEQNGILVFQLSLTQDKVRGFSLLDEKVPVIVIKRGSDPYTAKIFTLFHELGHIILGQSGICDVSLTGKSKRLEKWCNELAGETLVPRPNLMKHPIVKQYTQANVKGWRKKDLVTIGGHFNVGPLAVLRRLLEAGYTTSAFYKEKHEDWHGQGGFGRGGGRDRLKESVQTRGKVFTSRALNAFEANQISPKEAADYLDIKISDIDKVSEYLI